MLGITLALACDGRRLTIAFPVTRRGINQLHPVSQAPSDLTATFVELAVSVVMGRD
jgi:hypothetical protein